jgi:transposase
MSLTTKEINIRLTELRNLRKLYGAQKIKNTRLQAENKELKASVLALVQTVTELSARIEKLELRNEELLSQVFGKKSKSPKPTLPDPQTPFMPRSRESYQRPVPQASDITEVKHHTLPACGCGEVFTRLRQKDYYEEDIVLPKKYVTHHTVEQGYCCTCRTWRSARPLPCAKVVLGEDLQTYVCYATTILRLSYAQLTQHLQEVFHVHLSEGEIAKILHRRARNHLATYEQLKIKIRTASVIHMDETTDRIRDGDGCTSYTWLMQAMQAPEVVFAMGKTRGGGNARDLLGDSTAIGVTDDYGVYKKLFSEHQLCWAHLHRKLRDLATSLVLDTDTLNHCQRVYAEETALYAQVRTLVGQTDLSTQQRLDWAQTLRTQLSMWATPHALDPHKLSTYKKTLLKNIDTYLTCVRLPNVPCDNNQAEQSLRHIVLKRHISFGYCTQRGAQTMSILMSVCMTIHNRIKNTQQGFFETYAGFGV